MTAKTAATEPTAATGGHPQRWLILGVICLAQLTVLLDNTVLSVAIPSLTSELHATTTDIQWMINAYSLVQSGLLLSAGNAADRYGRKKLLAIGLALFGIGSLAAGLADSTAQLIAARAGMGVGGALLMTTTLAVVMQMIFRHLSTRSAPCPRSSSPLPSVPSSARAPPVRSAATPRFPRSSTATVPSRRT